MERISKIIALFVFIFFCPLSPVPSTLSYAAVPRLINYQGRLTDSGGAPLNGTYKLNFKLYNSAGTLLWQGTHNSVLVQKGVFSVLLGDANDAPYNFSQLAFDEPYFLEIKVCKIEGANEVCEVLSPRQQITSAAYAIRAGEAEKAINSDNLANQSPSYYLNHANLSGLTNNDHPQYARGKSNNVLIDFGNGSWSSQGQQVNVVFNVPFTSAPSVSVGVDETGGQIDDHGVECEVYNVTTSGFSFRNSRNSNGTFRWIAIGI